MTTTLQHTSSLLICKITVCSEAQFGNQWSLVVHHSGNMNYD